MRRSVLWLLVLVGFVLAIPGIGAAACVQGDLAGTWMVYVNTTDFDASWVKLKFVVGPTGLVKAGTSGADSRGESFAVMGGKLTLSTPAACSGSGTLTLKPASEPAFAVTLTQFTLQGLSPKNIFMGVGKDSKLKAFTFTGMKQQ